MTYKIPDYNGQEIQGSFYAQELQKTSQSIFRIEKVLKRQGDKCLVKWMGYPKSINSWILYESNSKTNYQEIALKLLGKKHELKHVLISTTKYHLTFISSHSFKNRHPHCKH